MVKDSIGGTDANQHDGGGLAAFFLPGLFFHFFFFLQPMFGGDGDAALQSYVGICTLRSTVDGDT